MARVFNSTKIRNAFEVFASQNMGKEMRTKDINNGVAAILGGSLGGWCVSDFAEPETAKQRSKYNKPLFKRIKRGLYLVQ